MVKIEDWCVGCESCLGYRCSNRHVEVHYCDNCGRELDEKNWSDNGCPEYCDECKELEVF